MRTIAREAIEARYKGFRARYIGGPEDGHVHEFDGAPSDRVEVGGFTYKLDRVERAHRTAFYRIEDPRTA